MIENKKNLNETAKKENQYWHEAMFKQNQLAINKDALLNQNQKLKNIEEKNTRFKIIEERKDDDALKLKENEEFDKMMVEKAKNDLSLEKFKNEEMKQIEYTKLNQIKFDNEVKQKELKKANIAQKQKDVELQEHYLAEEEKKEKMRQDQFNDRLKRIQDKMDRMADTVVKNEREQIIAEEKRILQLQLEKEDRMTADEQMKKLSVMEKNKMINKQLAVQMDEKRQVKEEKVKADKR